MMTMLTQRKQLTLLLLLTIFLFSVPAQVRAQNSSQYWSTVATTGEVDESSQTIIDYDGSVASIKTTAPSVSTVTVRYRVTPVHGLFFGDCKALKVRFRDDGNAAEVKLYLKKIDISSGAITTVLGFDSVLYPAMAGWQTQIGTCQPVTFDFANSAYWIEAIMTRYVRGGVQGNPGLQVIQITTNLV
jgi:hypothetical protein